MGTPDDGLGRNSMGNCATELAHYYCLNRVARACQEKSEGGGANRENPNDASSLPVACRHEPLVYNGHWSDHMRISSVREFRDKAAGLLRSKTPILVTRYGRLAGIFFPRPEMTLPIELKRELYGMLSNDVARQLKRRGISEDEVLKDFEASRRKPRAARRRR